MRVVKEHNERRNEILDTAQRLFATKGYDKCTINDILNEIGIAKGTFYHYFKSKEEVLDAIIDRGTQMIKAGLNKVVSNDKLNSFEKLFQCFLALRIEDKMEPGLLSEIHKPENALMHQKSLNSMVTEVTPILTDVVLEGVEEGVFQTEYPKEYMKIFLTSAAVLLDDGIFQVEQEEEQMTFEALLVLLCKMLTLDEKMVLQMVAQHWN